MATPIDLPKRQMLLMPLLASLPAAAISSEPPTALLPVLSPILRQRVQILSTSSEPWLSLLCYDDTIVPELETIAKSSMLELHPVSGLAEIDLESDLDIQYRYTDSETLEALASLYQLGLTIKLIWCTNDTAGADAGDGWRIREVGICTADSMDWGSKSLSMAVDKFKSNKIRNFDSNNIKNAKESFPRSEIDEEEEDDDNYWAQYDHVPGQTPKQVPTNTQPAQNNQSLNPADSEEEYYANYDMVQPAMENHDPDENINYSIVNGNTMPQYVPENSSVIELSSSSQLQNVNEAWFDGSIESSVLITKNLLPHPSVKFDTKFTDSNPMTNSERQGPSSATTENAIKTHIGATMKSLHRLARAAGIEMEEFDRVVRNQLDLMSMTSVDDDAF
ncbi:hypothetical protein GcM3_067013 [Golovinomyces cichoracearum]|uniref:Uncharacterized protein n=1 Tax=Golovinomyces cichoracearum TaxID=62708 RepID=A0A420IUB1_9PEZI|nr:hypothetical protein GcM3_067013 [Golovinomyces cichoracearum]